MEVRTGDTIEIMSNKVDEPSRRGLVVEVLDDTPLRVEVDWDDGHRSVLQPTGGNARVVSRAAATEG